MIFYVKHVRHCTNTIIDRHMRKNQIGYADKEINGNCMHKLPEFVFNNVCKLKRNAQSLVDSSREKCYGKITVKLMSPKATEKNREKRELS